MAIEIVDLPIKNGGSFHSYVSHYQRVAIAGHNWVILAPVVGPWAAWIFRMENQALWAYYNDGKQLLSDAQFKTLKEDPTEKSQDGLWMDGWMDG